MTNPCLRQNVRAFDPNDSVRMQSLILLGQVHCSYVKRFVKDPFPHPVESYFVLYVRPE
jgi:hypothetical protein